MMNEQAPINEIIQNGLLTNPNVYSGSNRMILPLTVKWQPKEDITAFELAQCLSYLNRTIMPWEISDTMTFMRHFEIFNPNI